MKGLFLTIVTVLLFTDSSMLSAQKTVYVDKHFQWTTDKEKAVEYAVISEITKKQTKIKKQYVSSKLLDALTHGLPVKWTAKQNALVIRYQ